MFIQVIKGKVTDADAVHAMGDRWQNELRPGADGFLGMTAGVTVDGTLVNLARFASREQAMANSSRPEQGAWWAEFEKLFDGPVDFSESDDVVIMGDDARFDSAGFVQVIEGRTSDADALKSMQSEVSAALAAERPELLGAIFVIQDDGTFVEAAYFTSEDEAHAGEQREPSDEVKAVMDRAMAVMSFESFYDLTEPRLR
ncbi:MAG TPA: hypothetical protein VF855_03845 [Acidimicrobiales bacterium]